MRYIFILGLIFQFFTTSALGQQYKYHIVKSGETVYSIAQDYNISVETLYTYNPDAKAGIAVNSKLVVPVRSGVSESGVEFKEHKVRRKETLFSLSQKYRVPIDAIKRYNPHLYSEELRRGERIRIPLNLPAVTEVVVANPEENPLGISIKEHVVLPKETFYAISRKYDLTIEELRSLNPGIDSLQPGMVLKIRNGKSVAVTPVEERLFKYYRVKPQETMYSLTAQLGISRDSLIVLNPALRDGLKAGMVLKIPNPDAGGIADYSEEDIVDLEKKISDFQPKEVVVMLPFALDKIVTTDTTSNAAERIKKDKVLQISLDFYSGVLMAVDSAQALGLSTNLRVYDTKQSAYEVSSIINSNNFDGVDAVIGPLVNSSIEAAVTRLRGRGIPVVSPLTKNAPRNLENYVQARPTDEMLEEAMISYLSTNAEGKNIVIIADSNKGAMKSKLLKVLPDSRTVNPIDGSYVSKSSLSSSLVTGKPNWVILESDNISVISDVTSALYSQLGTKDIVVFTTDRNGSFESDNISNTHLSRLKFTYPSVDKEFTGMEENTFVSAYFKKYGVVPNTYAVRGFDVTYDILLRLAAAEDLFASMEEEGTTEYVENKFDYDRKATGSYINKAIYILRYGEDMKLKVVK